MAVFGLPSSWFQCLKIDWFLFSSVKEEKRQVKGTHSDKQSSSMLFLEVLNFDLRTKIINYPISPRIWGHMVRILDINRYER